MIPEHGGIKYRQKQVGKNAEQPTRVKQQIQIKNRRREDKKEPEEMNEIEK